MTLMQRSLLAALSLGLIGALSTGVLAQDGATEAEGRTATDVIVEVSEAGQSPRETLRYTPTVGDEKRVRIELSSKMSQMGQTNLVPTMAITTTMMFDAVDEGVIRARVRIDEAEVVDDTGVQPMIAMQVKAGLKAAAGKVATLVTTDRGITERFEFREADKGEPMLRNTLESIENILGAMLAPLPVEAVGVGAQWNASTSISRSGITIDQKIAYSLKALEGRVMTLEVLATHSAANQTIKQQGMEITVETLESKGTGSATVALGDMAPTKGSMSTDVTTDLSFNQGGMAQQFTQTASSKSVISRPE